MNELSIQQNKLFDDIKHTDGYGREYWLARELQGVLQYKEWRNFQKVISTAQIACKISQHEVSDHFVEVNKMVEMPVKARNKQSLDFGFVEVNKSKMRAIPQIEAEQKKQIKCSKPKD